MKSLSILSIIVACISSSCNTSNTGLEEKIVNLEQQNKMLLDSLNTIKYENLVSSELILQPQHYTFKGETGIVSGAFRQRQPFPKFTLYYVNENFDFEEADSIPYELTTDNGFKFNIDSKTDTTLRVVAVFDLDTVKVRLPGITDLPNPKKPQLFRNKH